jgi:predicted dehydrogenase
MRIAIAGFGFMGKTHAKNILNNPDLKLVSVVDRDSDAWSNLDASGNFSTGSVNRESLASLHLYSDFDECLKKEKPDACIISVHTDLHFDFAGKALLAGANVFIEKPLALETDQCRSLIDLAAQKKLLLMVGHVVRFMPAYRKLKEWICNREFGDLKFLSLNRFSGLPSWGQWKEKQEKFGSSGGALFDLVIHDIDYVSWVLGDPDEIACVSVPGKLSNHDHINATWRYGNGTVVKIEGGNIFHSSFPFQAGYMACFEKASVLHSSLNPEVIEVITDTEVTSVPASHGNDAYAEELLYFFNCIRKGEIPSLCTPESALRTIELCHKHTNRT